jgi:flagellar M-ring protein FliF
MALSASELPHQASAFFRGLSLRQRLTLAGSAVIVAGTLWLFVALIGKGEYKTLYSGLTPSEARSIAQRLAAENVPTEVSADGATLRVPASQLDKVRLEMAADGLPLSGRLGFELFDKPNWAGSDFAEKVNYQRALEGELERTIGALSEVGGVRVHLVLPHESLFTENEREAKAAVLVRLRGGRMSDQSLNAISYLVSSAVDNLRPENVTVVDADGHVPLTPRPNGKHGPQGGAAEVETELADKLVATLAPVVGADQVKAKITVEYEMASSEQTQEAYDPNDSVVLTSQLSSDVPNSAEPDEGVPGAASNVPQANSPQPKAAPENSDAGSDIQGQKSENKTFAVGKTVKHVIEPAGEIKRISAAVLVDDALEIKGEGNQKGRVRRKRTPEEMKQIEALAAAAIGLNTQRGDRLAVENLPFTSTPLEGPGAPTLAERILPLLNQGAPVLRYVAFAVLFGVLYLLLLRPVKRQVVTTLRELPERLRTTGAGLAAAATDTRLLGSGAGVTPPSPQQAGLPEAGGELSSARALRDALSARIEKAPAEASRLVESWLRESGTG